MYHVDKYRLAAKREAESRGLLGDKKRNRGKTQIQVKEEEKVQYCNFKGLFYNQFFVSRFGFKNDLN